MFIGLVLAAAAGLAPVSDVRVGDDGDTARVVIVCGGECAVEPDGTSSFYVSGVAADFDIDVRSQSRHIRAIALRRGQGGSTLSVHTHAKAQSVRAARCGPRTYCFDYTLSASPVSAAASGGTVQRVARPTLEGISESLERLMHRTGLLEASAPEAMAIATQDAQSCQSAERALVADAWNLFAYRAVAICMAQAGQVQVAARSLERLDSFAARAGLRPELGARLTALR